MKQTNTTNSYTYSSYGCCGHRLPCGRCDVTGKMCYDTGYSPNWWGDIIYTNGDTTTKADYINNDKTTDINSDANKMLRC